jgi:DNA-binding MarR family transcriptional regulator
MSETFDADAVTRLRAALGRANRLLDRQVATDGLTRTQLSVLGTVSRRGPIGIGELADIEGLNPTMLSRVVAKLDDAGLINRTPDPADGRAARVQVTDAGRAVYQQVLQTRSEVLTAMLRELPPGEPELLLAALPALESLVEHIAAQSTTAAPTGGGRR